MQARRLRLSVLLAAALLMAALASGSALVLGRMRQAAEAAATETVERTVRVVEGAVNRHFLSVDGMLAGLPGVLGAMASGGRLDAEAANRLLRGVNFQNFTFRDIVLVRPDGGVWAAALPGSRLRPPALEPPALSGTAGPGGAAIIGPLPNPTTGEWALFMVRRIVLPEVGPLSAVAEVPVSLFATLLAPFEELRGLRIAIERGDGTLLASLPHDEARIGRPVDRSAAALPADGQAQGSGGRLDPAAVLQAVRGTLYRDIYVAASIEAKAAMAEWRQDRARLLFGMAGISLLLCGSALGLSLALRQRELSDAERAKAWRMLENALESLPDGFVMFDAEDKLVVCNQRYRDLYAVSAPFITPGAAFDDIIREGARRGQYPQAGEDIEAFVAEIRAWHRGDNPPMERLLPDGRWILVTERRTPDGGTVGIRTDISALKQAIGELAAARDVAAAATEAKSRFLARMSHELRTPLNGVLGLAQALAGDARLPEDARARARTLEMAGRHLLAVANDVLDLARAEAGRLELRPAPIALATLLESCATLTRPAAEERRLRLRVGLSPDLPRRVEADATRLRQLLLNLLSNAVKFSPKGEVVDLRAATLGAPDANGRVPVRIEVRDAGPGVPEAARDAIFGDFVQLERDGAADGAGLGLSIAAHIVASMGGRIGCEENSEATEGRGSVFWVELPLPQAAEAAPGPQPRPAASRDPSHAHGAGSRLRVLVVDDVPANLAVARALLESAGHAAVCVAGGRQALAAIAAAGTDGTAPFDAVLMDVMMPGMDGLEATRNIREMGGWAGRLPIFAVTASVFAEDVAACGAAGMTGHLAKPIERDVLLRTLAALGRPRTGGGTPAAPGAIGQEGRGGLAALPLLQRGAGRRQIQVPGIDSGTALRLVPEFQREIRKAAEEIRAAGPVPSPALVQAAHRLAGSAATLGAERLAAAARALEIAARQIPPAVRGPALAEALGVALHVADDTDQALDDTLRTTTSAPEAVLSDDAGD